MSHTACSNPLRLARAWERRVLALTFLKPIAKPNITNNGLKIMSSKMAILLNPQNEQMYEDIAHDPSVIQWWYSVVFNMCNKVQCAVISWKPTPSTSMTRAWDPDLLPLGWLAVDPIAFDLIISVVVVHALGGRRALKVHEAIAFGLALLIIQDLDFLSC